LCRLTLKGKRFDMEAQVSFGGWVVQQRKALDLTREQLARRVGCSVSGLRKIESDERRPSRQVAELLADCLQVPCDQRPTFVKAARGVERVERLGTPLTVSAAVRTKPAPPCPASNLPTPSMPLIGREDELAMLARLLRDSQCRLITLAGPGGVGKTRLAIEVASTQRELFSGGVCFVPLASHTSSEFIAPAVADALGFVFSGPLDPQVQLLNHLRQKSLLLVLDDIEHLLEGAGLLAEMLEQAPGVKLLVTSRERLNLRGEWLFDIQGLPVPPLDQVDRAAEYSAVALFVHSAKRAQVGFELRAEDRPWVARICQSVEGMPLAMSWRRPRCSLAGKLSRRLSATWISCPLPRVTCRNGIARCERCSTTRGNSSPTKSGGYCRSSRYFAAALRAKQPSRWRARR
jgi:transcriptional regulator with XRE-family HTH domain